jgi:hypothetical protein
MYFFSSPDPLGGHSSTCSIAMFMYPSKLHATEGKKASEERKEKRTMRRKMGFFITIRSLSFHQRFSHFNQELSLSLSVLCSCVLCLAVWCIISGIHQSLPYENAYVEKKNNTKRRENPP